LAAFSIPIDHPEIEPKAKETEAFEKFVEEQIQFADSKLQAAIAECGSDWEARCLKIVERYPFFHFAPDWMQFRISTYDPAPLSEIETWLNTILPLTISFDGDAKYLVNCFEKIYFASKNSIIRDHCDWMKSDGFITGINNCVADALQTCRSAFATAAEPPSFAPEQLMHADTFEKRVKACKNVLQLCDIVELIEKKFNGQPTPKDVEDCRKEKTAWIAEYPVERKKQEQLEVQRVKERQERLDNFKATHMDPLGKLPPFQIDLEGAQFAFNPQSLELKMSKNRFAHADSAWTFEINGPDSSYPSAIRVSGAGATTTISASYDGNYVTFRSSANANLLTAQRDDSAPNVWRVNKSTLGPAMVIKIDDSAVSLALEGEIEPEKSALIPKSGSVSPASAASLTSPLVIFATLLDYVHFWIDKHENAQKKMGRICKSRVSGDGYPASLGKICCGWSSAADRCFICSSWHHNTARAVLCMDHGFGTGAEKCVSCDKWLLSASDRTPAFICYTCYTATKWDCTKVGAAKAVEIPPPK
jgi:hypothetical protein